LNAASLGLLRKKTLETFLDGLSDEEILALLSDWTFWARPEQIPPKDDWSIWLLLGGRGSGKTRAGSEWVRAIAEGPTPLARGEAVRIALVADNLHDAREVMIDGVSGILSLPTVRPDFRPVLETSRQRLVWPNGTVAQYYSAQDPDSLRGAQFSHAWIDELSKFRYAQRVWDMLQFALRLGPRPRQVVTTTPRPIDLLKKLMDRTDLHTSVMRTLDNKDNLPPAFFDSIVKRYEGTRLGRQELDGEILEDNHNALWARRQLDHLRRRRHPDLQRIVVAVDPAVSARKTSDECGIVVAGIDQAGHLYILADRTVSRAKPLVWAGKVVAAFHEFQADRVVAEVNQGGDLVRSILAQIDPGVPVRSVHATRGKWLRAEPVAALYEQERVHHVGVFPQLEDQMCEFDPTLTGSSFDRLDALVWACTELTSHTSSGSPRIHAL